MNHGSVHGDEKRFVGIGAAPGIVSGRIYVHGQKDLIVAERGVAEEEVPGEIAKLEEALISTRQQLQEIQKRISSELGEQDAAIFDAHIMVLEDPSLIDEVVKQIQNHRLSADSAFEKVSSQYARTLAALDDEYLRERASDIQDVTQRVLRNLVGSSHDDLHALKEPCIVISYDLAPSETANMDKSKVMGFATDIGSKTSHTAIMARAMDIPAVVGLHDVSHHVRTGDFALIDGYEGILILHPNEQTLYEYGQLEKKRHSIEVSLQDIKDLSAETVDHCRVALNANIEMPDDVPHVIQSGADGVGLFRTEYVFINRDDVPSEEEQFRAYHEVAERLYPKPVIIRTLDLGGDKFLSHLQIASEMNPFLGWRAIRFCLERTDIFRTQLRAILRASRLGNVRLMYPMISGVEELRRANHELDIARDELKASHIPFDETMPVGSMIEIPSAAITADVLARECSFFSIGTNDLIQYSLAVDRVNEKIAHLYQPTHPAIIRLINNIVSAAHLANIKVSICGEMAGDVALAPLLIGLEVDELSASPPVVPQLKKIIRALNKNEAHELAQRALQCSHIDEIRRMSTDLARRVAPEILELSGE